MLRRGAIFVFTALAAHAAAAATYVGEAACVKCHASIGTQWSHSRHSKMVQPATATSVRGDFTSGRINLRNQPYSVRQRNGIFYITESYLTGKPVEHKVEYTLGNRRIQLYLTTLPDGRIIVLPPSWDILRKEWFHDLDIDDPEQEPGVQTQLWNKSCYSCHVSQEEKHFDVNKNIYKTTWLNFGTNCERCHGPGSQHVADYSAAVKPKSPPGDIVLQTKLTPARNTMVCAQCHSFRDIYVQNFKPGDDYYSYFMPVLEFNLPEDGDPAYYADNRTRRFSNDSFGLWQSECFLKGGATCVTCHVEAHETEIEHNPQLRPDANALCTRCHEGIGKALTAHTHHAPASTGSSCVECHMPRTVFSIKAEIRDHSMSIPIPENTINHAIPNACNQCHKDQTAQWSLARMNEWYKPQSRQKLIRRADTFAAARKRDPASVDGLLAILSEPSEGPLTRGNAAGYLGRFGADPRVPAALSSALTDSEPLVRSLAAQAIASTAADRRPAAVPALTHLLADPAGAVRLSALVTLVGWGYRELSGADGELLKSARALYESRAALGSDDAGQEVAAGKFFMLTADPDRAIDALRASLRIDPAAEAQYFLAGAYAEKNDLVEARKILEAIPPTDPQYDRAQRLLRVILAQSPHF